MAVITNASKKGRRQMKLKKWVQMLAILAGICCFNSSPNAFANVINLKAVGFCQQIIPWLQ
jgi:hypothetical protein